MLRAPRLPSAEARVQDGFSTCIPRFKYAAVKDLEILGKSCHMCSFYEPLFFVHIMFQSQSLGRSV